MFLLQDETIVYSASDLAAAATCELALLRSLDGRLGRSAPLELAVDAMLERTARLGDRHEERVLAAFVAEHGEWDRTAGTGVARIERPGRDRYADRATLEAKHAETIDALRTGADVVFQAGFFDGRFGGWADFLVRAGSDGDATHLPPQHDGPWTGEHVYAVYDTKLARRAKVTALLQLAAYADQLLASGIRVSDRVHLILGDRSTTDHRLADLLPVYRERRQRLQTILDEHQAEPGPVAWGDDRYRACLRCEVCTPELAARRDVLLVAGMRTTQRARLHAAGLTTIDELAASPVDVSGIGTATLARLREQARLQVRQAPPGHDAHGEDAHVGPPQVEFELYDPSAVEALPAPDPGDLFFDFEGDPLWAEDAPAPDGTVAWGLEYLFGVVEAPVTPDVDPVFRPFWAHDRAQERQALVDFLGYVEDRRAQFPDMHVYHYAPYEKTALLRLAGRYGVGEDAVDRLLREGVLVDLYATVRSSLRTGQDSYSLKKLEPLYMDVAREGDVTTAGDSIVEYADACAVRDEGDLVGWQARLDAIARYNEYDCLSTLRLRDWLLAQAGLARAVTAAAGPLPGPDLDGPPDTTPDEPERDEVAAALLAFAAGAAVPGAAVAGAAVAGAAVTADA